MSRKMRERRNLKLKKTKKRAEGLKIKREGKEYKKRRNALKMQENRDKYKKEFSCHEIKL